jgi:hypothetical protein
MGSRRPAAPRRGRARGRRAAAEWIELFFVIDGFGGGKETKEKGEEASGQSSVIVGEKEAAGKAQEGEFSGWIGVIFVHLFICRVDVRLLIQSVSQMPVLSQRDATMHEALRLQSLRKDDRSQLKILD